MTNESGVNRNENESEMNRFIDNWDDERLLEVGREQIDLRGQNDRDSKTTWWKQTNSKAMWKPDEECETDAETDEECENDEETDEECEVDEEWEYESNRDYEEHKKRLREAEENGTGELLDEEFAAEIAQFVCQDNDDDSDYGPSLFLVSDDDCDAYESDE